MMIGFNFCRLDEIFDAPIKFKNSMVFPFHTIKKTLCIALVEVLELLSLLSVCGVGKRHRGIEGIVSRS